MFYKHALVLLDDFLNGRRHERVHVVKPLDVRLLFFLDGLDALDSLAVFGKVAFGDDRRVDLSSVVLVLKSVKIGNDLRMYREISEAEFYIPS